MVYEDKINFTTYDLLGSKLFLQVITGTEIYEKNTQCSQNLSDHMSVDPSANQAQELLPKCKTKPGSFWSADKWVWYICGGLYKLSKNLLS